MRLEAHGTFFQRAIPPALPPTMKTLNFKARIAIATGMLALLSLPSMNAQTSLDFVPFETGGVTNVTDLDFIDLEALIIAAPGGVTIGIHNNSTIGDPYITSTQPTITRIFFEDRAGVLGNDVSIADSTGVVSLQPNDGANLPGGNNISFQVDTAFVAKAPPTTNGLSPGESVVFLFNGSVYDALVASIVSGDFRIALHVQQIGMNGEDSAAFVTIPEPASAMLGLIGTLLLLRRRR
jgi:hypothetical protein